MGAIGKAAALSQTPAGMILAPEIGIPMALANKAGLGKLGKKGPLSGMIGQAGGAAGTGFNAPQDATVQQGTNAGDVINAQTNTNNSLASQQALLSALQGQNGLGQQNAVAGQQGALYNQLNAANGIGTQNAAIHGLQGAADQYGNIAAGRGPNPAQAMLNQATGQNVANQAALMAGQRGAGSNVGLMARQAAQQGAATQQQAVGQGATMQANQQINALAGLTGANQAMGGLGTSQLGAQQAQQQAMANQANTIAGQQIAGTNANTQANLSNQQQLQGALQGYNNNVVSSQNSINSGNAALADRQMQGQQGIVGGIMGGIGAGMGMAKGGEVPKMADGGIPQPVVPPLVQPMSSQQFFQQGPVQSGPTSSFGQFLNAPLAETALKESDDMAKKPPKEATDSMGSAPLNEGSKKMTSGLLSGAMMASKGGLANSGGNVKAAAPGQKAVKGGDSYSNDKITAKLSEHEIVLPRSVTMSDDPVRNSAEFVRKVLAKRKMK